MSKQIYKSAAIGIDLGTANTYIYIKNKGITIKEPTVIALDKINNKILAVGKEAKKMVGKTPEKIQVIKPLKKGVIADYDITRELLKYFLDKSKVRRQSVLLSVPYGTTHVERRAVIEAAIQAGAKNAYLIEEPLAAAIGADLPVEEATGNMVLNIGGGTSEIAIISLGGIVNGKSVRIAGNTLDEAIRNYIRKKFRVDIGESTAENIKIEIGSAVKKAAVGSYKVTGIDLKNGLPITIEISSSELVDVLKEPIKEILFATKDVFEKAPPQLASDIIENGITLTGGGAKLKGFNTLIEKNMNLMVKTSDEPQESVINGIGKVITHSHDLSNITLFSP